MTVATLQKSDLGVEPSTDIRIANTPQYPEESMSTDRQSYLDEVSYPNESLFMDAPRSFEAETASHTRTRCTTSCTVYAPDISVVSWVPEEKIVYTEKVVVGIITTLTFLCNDIVVALRTQTEYRWDAAPAGMYPPLLTTNDRGNAVAIAVFTDTAITSVVEMVYPNSHIAYGNRFSWEGVIDISLYDENPGVCLTATSELSTTYLESHRSFSRDRYPEPTATRTEGKDVSGRGYRPLWVPLDSQPSDTFFDHLRMVFYSLMQDIHTYGAWLECDLTASVSPTPSIFYEPYYFFDHKTLSIDLDASGMGNASAAGRWQNSTGSGAFCMDYMQQFANLCEKPEIKISTDDGCTNTITIWENASHTYDLFTNTKDGDRTGAFFRPSSKTGFETAYDLTGAVVPFRFATDDWVLDSKGGVIYTPGPPATKEYHNPGASEAAANSKFLKGHSEESRVNSWSRPQRTQPPTRSAQGLEPIRSEAVSQYFREPLEYPAQPLTSTELASALKVMPTSFNTIKAHGLAAIPSAFNRIFFHGTPATHVYTEVSTTNANGLESRPGKPIVVSDEAPVITKEKVADAIANILPDSFTTTPQEFLYVQVFTIVDSVPKPVAGYALPMTPTMIASQEIAVDGQVSKLAIPDLLPMYLSTTIDGIPTSILVYIVSGRSTPTVGQTITGYDSLIALPLPIVVFTQLATLISGIETTTPAYIINGTFTASIGQKITVNGKPVFLTSPSLVPTYIAMTTIGVEESGLAYVVIGETTATGGQTVTVAGSTRILAKTSSQPHIVEGVAHKSFGISLSTTLLLISVVFVLHLYFSNMLRFS